MSNEVQKFALKTKKELPTTQKQLRNNTEKYMLSLQSNPQKVANFFKHPKVQYAALDVG
ncbi:MAG: hypothetical protein FAF05_06895 [Epsilonproteobacteria bacterium]|nr:hypothetical protein [Campylobacterota bacterium]